MQFTHFGRRLQLLALPLLLLVLSACGSPPPAETPTVVTVDGVVNMRAGDPPILAAALVFLDVTAPVVASSVTEVLEDVYMGPLAVVGADGSFSLEYPAGSDLPAALLAPVEESIVNLMGFAGCSLFASDSSVMTTTAVFQGVTMPGIGLITAAGSGIAMATADALPETPTPADLVAARFQTWIYASGPTSLVTEPATCIPTNPTDPTISVSATLTEGWNQLEWTVEADELGAVQGFKLSNSTAEELHVVPASSFGAS